MARCWFYKELGDVVGPLRSSELARLAQDGSIDAATPVRKGVEGTWVLAGRVKGLAKVVRSKPGPVSLGRLVSERLDREARAADDLGGYPP